MGRADIVWRIGVVLVWAGCLLVAFVAFQLWGTALYTDHAQGNLRTQLDHKLGRTSLPLASLESARPGSDPAKSSGIPPIATSVAPTTAQPGVGQPIGLLAIPKLGLDDVVVQGTGEPQLQGGPGHYLGTALPGQMGNAAIAGHRTTFAAPFYDLNELVRGDPVFVLTSQGLFRYDVAFSEVVSPGDTAVLDTASYPELTLTTCNPRYSASSRLVVVALLDLGAKAPSIPSTKGPATNHDARPQVPASDLSQSLAGSTSGQGGQVLPAVIWGVLFLAGLVALRVGARRLRRPVSWGCYVVGVPLLLAALFLCFSHVSLALPASF